MTQAHRSTAHGGKAPGGSRCDGFTLIEVITVLLIVGILASVVLSRGAPLNSELPARVGEVRSQLRYLQLMAMKNGINLALTCDGTNYWAHNSTNASLPLPGESAALISLADKKMQMTPFSISFDAFGIPYTGSPLAKLTNNATTISITVGGKTDSLSVTPETGFVP